MSPRRPCRAARHSALLPPEHRAGANRNAFVEPGPVTTTGSSGCSARRRRFGLVGVRVDDRHRDLRCRCAACVARLSMGKNWGWRYRRLGMTGRKVGRTSGFRESPLTLHDGKRNLSPVRRQKPAEPQATAARWKRGKPKGMPQGGTAGSRENTARWDRGMGANPARGRDRSGFEASYEDGP
jgi:hypothetical protein